ncbi:MAG: pilus assembly protein PilM [Raoultibacter sp.]
MAKTYTGIDMGSSFLKLAVCNGDSIKKMIIEPVPEGLVRDNKITSYDAMADFIKRTISAHGGVDKDAALLLPNTMSLTRRLSLPMMTQAELDLNLPYEFRDFITDGKDHYVYDYAVLNTVQTKVPLAVDAAVSAKNTPAPAGTLNLLAVATRKDTLEDYTRMCRRAGLKVRTALSYAAALQNLVQASGAHGSQPAAANCCIIDFGNETTNLYFFAAGTYDVTRALDMGGEAIDRAIADVLGIDEHTAAIHKESDYAGAQSSEAVLNVCEGLAVEIGRALNFYDFNNPDAPIEMAYYSGGGAALSSLVPTVARHLEIPLVDVATIMPTASCDAALRTRCSGAVGATIRG